VFQKKGNGCTKKDDTFLQLEKNKIEGVHEDGGQEKDTKVGQRGKTKWKKG